MFAMNLTHKIILVIDLAFCSIIGIVLIDLDLSYGKAIIPKEIEGYEQDETPVTVENLDSNNAPKLLEYMSTSNNGLKLTKLISEQLPILWVIDEHGDLRFAIEEYLNIEDTKLRVGRFGGMPTVISSDTVKWVLNNHSGRYGVEIDRKKDHLIAVQQLFKKFGLEVGIDWEDWNPPKFRNRRT